MTRSIVGAVLAGIYFLVATFITQDEIRHSAGGWISLRGMMTGIVTAPSQVTVGTFLKAVGVRPVIVSTVLVYYLGAGIQWLVAAGWRAAGQAGG
jgi:hypothetical protein